MIGITNAAALGHQADAVVALLALGAMPLPPVGALSAAPAVPRAVLLLPVAPRRDGRLVHAAAQGEVVLAVHVAEAALLEEGQAQQGLLELALPRELVGPVLDGVPLLPPALVGRALLALADAVEQLVQAELARLVLELEHVRDEARVQLGVALARAEELSQVDLVERVAAVVGTPARVGRALVSPLAAGTVCARCPGGIAPASRVLLWGLDLFLQRLSVVYIQRTCMDLRICHTSVTGAFFLYPGPPDTRESAKLCPSSSERTSESPSSVSW